MRRGEGQEDIMVNGWQVGCPELEFGCWILLVGVGSETATAT